jgi:MoaA/NifB/PqqE/SkfB family radical SAM enzyme
MRFPLRLTAELLKAQIVGMGRGNSGATRILRVGVPADASEESATSPSTNSAADEEILRQVKASSAPIVWIGGGAEPLADSGVGHLTRRIADLGRTVFVETDGVLLRRRIFSFRPVPGMYLTVRLAGTEAFHDRHENRAGVYRAAIEGIRAARLSGFLICAKTTVLEDTDLKEMAALKKLINELELDGWVVTQAAKAAPDSAIEETLAGTREMIGRRWAKFSRMVEESEASHAAEEAMESDFAADLAEAKESYEQEARLQ